MIGRLAIVALMLAGLAGPALAQPVPFDMAPERPSRAAPRRPEHAQAAGPAPGDHPCRPPAVAPEPPAAPTETPAAAPAPPPAAAPAAPQPAATAAPAARPRRFRRSRRGVRARGEMAQRSWAIYLTPEQAASPASLILGYQSSIVVAPEASQLRVSINGIEVMAERLRSPDDVIEGDQGAGQRASRPASIRHHGGQPATPDGLHHPVHLRLVDRHRSGAHLPGLRRSGTPPEPRGSTTSAPSASIRTGRHRLQPRRSGPRPDSRHTPSGQAERRPGAAGGTPNQAIHIDRESAPKPEPGVQTVVVGTAAELRGVIAEIAEGASSSAIVQIRRRSELRPRHTGRRRPVMAGLEGAIESLVAAGGPPCRRSALGAGHAVLACAGHAVPDRRRPPDVRSARCRRRRSSPGAASAPTSRSACRRTSTPPPMARRPFCSMPPIRAAVLPGSHIDIYVNDNIAATVPITTGGGGILRHLPIGVTMRHFRPGVNVIAVEAVLLTREDAVCAAGATHQRTARFALFDTSEFSVPRFARIGQRPNLSAFAGTGFPYNRTATGAAGGRQRCRFAVGGRHPAGQAVDRLPAVRSPSRPCRQSGLDRRPRRDLRRPRRRRCRRACSRRSASHETSRTAWGEAVAERDAMRLAPDTEATFDRWRDELSGRGWRGQVSVLRGLADPQFRHFAELTAACTPQRHEPISARRRGHLAARAGQQPRLRRHLDGAHGAERDRAVGLDARLGRRRSCGDGWTGASPPWKALPVKSPTFRSSRVAFFETQPFSLANYRLIAANWLSANILSYSASLFALCTMLGVATSALLTTLGRRN